MENTLTTLFRWLYDKARTIWSFTMSLVTGQQGRRHVDINRAEKRHLQEIEKTQIKKEIEINRIQPQCEDRIAQSR